MHRLALLLGVALIGQGAQKIGQFDTAVDVGEVGLAGSTVFDAKSGVYRVTGAGANIWAGVDAFQYVQRRVAGDVTATAEVGFPDKEGNAHKKGGLMLRASLDADAPHASVMVHADGLISLQYRREKGGPTAEVRSFLKGPARVRMARHGDVISYEVARPGGEWQPSGAVTVVLPESAYLGLAVCSHDEKELRPATFSGVTVQEDGVVAAKDRVVESTLEIVTVATGERRIVQRVLAHFEAPNWTADGSTLVYNGGGKIYRIPVAGGTPVLAPTGDVRVNNDHGLSPDGKMLAISGSVGRGQSQIYLVPVLGGEPKLITPLAPSYWHGWSPDGKTLAYCASRNGEFDIYTIPAAGGAETRLTTAAGLDDGPEYSPDGQYIYFNSDRSGLMRIWRMKANGEGQEMMSQGPETADWFAHISPDGQRMVYISYDPSVKGHPANKDVTLRIAPAGGGAAKTVVTLFGGQGTMNVPSWSPDGQSFAFVSYRLVKGR
ncbi:MAG: TolB family protein [Bryobacterales bacterium]|nr:TolB family protein [Bryobacterales bacterium]